MTARQASMGIKDNTCTFPVVKELRLLCATPDVEPDVVWKPGSDTHQQVAHAYSKVLDKAQWCLHPLVYEALLRDPVLAGCTPAMDIFASSCNIKL